MIRFAVLSSFFGELDPGMKHSPLGQRSFHLVCDFPWTTVYPAAIAMSNALLVSLFGTSFVDLSQHLISLANSVQTECARTYTTCEMHNRGRRDSDSSYASVFVAASLFTAFVFMADYIDTTGTNGSAAVLLGIIGMASIVGRLATGAFAARFGAINLFRLSCLGLGLSYLIWLGAGTSYPLLVVFALVLGVAYGGIIALSPAVLAQLFGTVGMGGVLGALYTASGFGGLIGPPVMGRIIDSAGHSAAQWTSLAGGLIGAVLLYPLKPQDS